MTQGEGIELIESIHRISNELLKNLNDVDQRLRILTEKIELSNPINKQEVLQDLTEIRLRINSCEREDKQEIEDEEILEDMMKKLDTLIEMTIGNKPA